ncbi:hypothetical protein DL763_010684 [Monosporascus cannonballus]|nr:hypothetical protein DL763_010684 [Monosporascus cannonballus]
MYSSHYHTSSYYQEAMAPSSPDLSYELGELTQARADAETSTDSPGANAPSPPLLSSAVRTERQRVRFNSSAAERLPRDRSASKDREGQPGSSGVRKPRPALTRNPASYNSVLDDVHNIPLSPEKEKSAAEAARRAQALAADAQQESETMDNGDPGPNDSSGRWSPESEPVTEASYTGEPFNHGYQPPELGGTQQHALNTSEARELLQAHWHYPGHHIDSIPDDNAAGKTESDEDPAPRASRGGVFYNILQAYRYSAYDSQEQHKVETPRTPGTPKTPGTPTRRKWYDQPEKDYRSQETLARLVGASAKLANPNDNNVELKERKKSPKSRKMGGGRVMSMIRLRQEEEAKITVHIADILQRQKYLIKMCRALMLFGAPTHRLEEYLDMSAKMLEVDSQFLYIPGCMIISFDDPLTHTTEVKIVRTAQGVNLGKLKDVHTIYKEVLHDVISLDEALSRLDAVIKSKDNYSVWLCVLMYGLASTAVSTFFGARLIDMPVIFVLGSLLGVLQLVIAPMSKTYYTVFEVSAAILMTFISRAIASIRGGGLFCFSALTQSAIVMILPGWLVLSSALELQSKAIVPGSIRMVFAIIYSLFLGYGITVGTALYGAIDSNATTEISCRDPMSPYWSFLLVPLYVFFTTFTIQAKWTQMPVMILVAQAGYVVSFYANRKFAASAQIASTFGALTIGVLANLYSRVRHGVAAAVLLPAVYVQLPGSLAASGAIVSGLQTATSLKESAGLNGIVFNVAASMIQIAIGITVGLFMSALVIYPMGKRRSGLWTLQCTISGLSLDILYYISGFLDVADLFRLSSASRDLWSMLLFRRATAEVHWMLAATTFGPRLFRHVSSLHAAIERWRPLPVIETILRAYRAVDPALVHGCPPPGHSYHPPLHLAAVRNRFDVVGALLVHGADVDVRESGIWTGCRCRPVAGVRCGTPGCATGNTLDVARHAGNVEMAPFLLERGIEDLGRD